MNITRVKEAIDIMKRIPEDRFDIGNWRSRWTKSNQFLKTEDELLQDCGTAACFAGWVAVSPEFRRDGGRASNSGAPMIHSHGGADAIAYWLDITMEDAHDLCMPQSYWWDMGLENDDVLPKHVIERLEGLLSRELKLEAIT